MEGFLTPINDLFPKHLYKTKNRMILAAVYCSISFLLGLSMVTQVSVITITEVEHVTCTSTLQNVVAA